MRRPLLLISLSLAVLLPANVLTQDPVQIQFQTDPLLVQTGSEIVFTVLTVPDVLSMTWEYEQVTLGLFAGGQPTVNAVPQFLGRVTISANQLRIGGAQLGDAGTYTVEVTPSATTGLGSNSRSIELSVFDAVAGVTLVVPSVAVEGGNVSLMCSLTGGTGVSYQWGRGGVTIGNDSRITIIGGSLVINPARRSDTGEYSCTVSNPVSAQTDTQRLTIFYGPDTPVLTIEAPKDCVGEGDVMVGQMVRLTCLSDSLPPALFSWTFDGLPVSTAQPDSGVLSVQTFSTDESGRYVCTARNAVTTGTSEQETALTIVDVCLSGGEVAGIVIGSVLLLLLIIALIIWLVVFLVRRRRGTREDPPLVQRVKENPRIMPPDPRPNGARDLDPAPNPPLYQHNTNIHQPARFYTAPRENRGSPQMLQLDGLHNSNTNQPNGAAIVNGFLHGSVQNANSPPHNGVDNPAFTHADVRNVNAQTQQNPNIVIQTGAPEGGAQPQAVHVSLNTLPQSAQQNGNAQMPTIHFNLNSYSNNGQRAQQDSSFPVTNNNILETQQNLAHAGQLNPIMQQVPPYQGDPRWNGQIETLHQGQPDLIPTGFTHVNGNNVSHRNARTQTYQQEAEPRRSSIRRPDRRDTGGSSARRQMPWDRVRATPSFPSGTFQRRENTAEITSDATDYTAQPPPREDRTPNSRAQSRAHSQTEDRRRTPPRKDESSVDNRTETPSIGHRILNIRGVKLLEAAHQNQRTPPTRKRTAQPDSRSLSGSQTAARQEVTHSNSRARSVTSQQVSVGVSAVPEGPLTQQGQIPLQMTDTRALVDPNHLPQAFMNQQLQAVPIQRPPQGPGTQTRPVAVDTSQPRQAGAAPVTQPAAQPVASNLTQDAVRAHAQRAQVFQNRRQQTQAALQHPGTQAQAPAEKHPPPPPPVIPLAQFQALPKKSIQHRSPNRGHQPPRPPVNMPVAQRPHPVRQQPNAQHHHATLPPNHHHPHHHHGNVNAHRHTQGHPTHFTHPRQAHRGRPR
ncbi:uncharacterized protein si:dkeyp-97a10.3 isoform X2 [Antennarius striatus]|uniref:uncharacterized protein si:dkeyp-97a10.3 isoform X2 n=1 Tax=Antennarius striatus TaxID=241820 RepID=UPI0035AE897B